MCCGRCCATEPRLRAALRLDIFIEILLWTLAIWGTVKGRVRSSPSVRRGDRCVPYRLRWYR
jgi:hypothetical protein